MDPEKLGERDILPVRDSIRFKLLNKAKNELLKRYDKKIPFSCVIEYKKWRKKPLVKFFLRKIFWPQNLLAEKSFYQDI